MREKKKKLQIISGKIYIYDDSGFKKERRKS